MFAKLSIKLQNKQNKTKQHNQTAVKWFGLKLLSILEKHSKRKDSTPTKHTAGDLKTGQLFLPVLWQESQLQEGFCS